MSEELAGRRVVRAGAAVAGWFVRPARAAGDRHDAQPAARAGLDEPVILAAAGTATLGFGASIALAIARDGVAVLACWRVPAAHRRRGGLAVGGARRLVASLQARGVEATASGRLVVVVLPDEVRDALMLLRRVEAAGGGAVCLPLLGGARAEEWDAVLRERGVAVLHGADAALVELAAQRLAEQRVEVRIVDAVPGALARSMAAAGWTPPGARALRRSVCLA